MEGRQQPILLTGGHFMSTPRTAPGRKWEADYITISADNRVPLEEYVVVTTASDNASPKWLVAGDVKANFQLPYIQFCADTIVGFIPKNNPHLPKYRARLNRASHYHLPYVPISAGVGPEIRIVPKGVMISTVNDM